MTTKPKLAHAGAKLPPINYYTRTNDILAGLGKMYVADERFKKNIDKYGEGTAEFVAEGIRIYVENK